MDCTVHATAIAAQIPYYEAHQLLARFGRRPRHGVNYNAFISGVCVLSEGKIGAYRVQRVKIGSHDSGERLMRRPQAYVTLGQFLKDFPNGRFVVRKRGHVFAVIDGKQFDASPNSLRCRLTGVYHFAKESI